MAHRIPLANSLVTFINHNVIYATNTSTTKLFAVQKSHSIAQKLLNIVQLPVLT